MKLSVTNATRGMVSLPNGQVLDLGDSIFIFICDEAYAVVESGSEYTGDSKDVYSDVDLYAALKSLAAQDDIVLSLVEGSGGGFVVLPLAGFVAGVYPDDITANASALVAYVATKPGQIVNAGLYVAGSGMDDINPLSLELDVMINGTSIFSILPLISKSTWGVAANTFKAGYGVTVGVVDGEANTLAVGDVVTFDLELIRTASPTEEMAGAVLVLEIQ